MYYLNKLRLVISGIMLIFAVVHTVWPDLAIDAITLALLGIAVTPWLAPLFKTIELPGGVKIEFQDTEKVAEATAALAAASTARFDGAVTPEIQAREATSAAGTVMKAVTATNLQQASQSVLLWVDDKPSNNVLERRALEALGITFVLATSTQEALEKLKNSTFGAVISDMGREGDVDAGYTLLDSMRQRGINTSYIIYAASRSPEHVVEARKHGALGYTNRPDELFQLVMQTL